MPNFAWKYKRKYFRPKQRKAYTMLGLTLLSLIIFGNFAIRPAVVTIVELQKKIKDQKETVEKLDQKIRNLSKAQTELRKIKSDLPLIERALPKNEDTSHLLENLYLQAERHDLRMEYLRFLNEASTEIQTPNDVIKIKKAPFSGELGGDFVSFLDFLKQHQNSLRQINMESLVIKSGRGGSQELYNFNSGAFFYTNE